ncbi:ubinuclein-2-like [Arapaima gigas]
MAEPRRVPFVTVSGATTAAVAEPKKRKREDEEDTELGGGGAVGPGAGGGSLVADGARRWKSETVRLEVRLSEPSVLRSAEFSYSDLLFQSRQNKNTPLGLTPALDPSDPLADEEQERREAEALARKFESKYGNSGKKKRKDRIVDLIDIGFGYDESDSFIDNSEPYDELVPASLNTKLGGFYINMGTLQFRAASDSEGEEPGKEGKRTQNQKACEESVKKRKKKQEGGGAEKKPKKIKAPKPGVLILNTPRPEKKKRKKLMADSLNMAAFMRRFGREKDVMRKKQPANANRVLSSRGNVLPGPHPKPFPSTSNLCRVTQTANTAVKKSFLGSANSGKVLQDLMGNMNFGVLNCPLPSGSAQGANGFPGIVGKDVGKGVLVKGQALEGLSGGLISPPPLPSGLPATLTKRIEDLRMASRQFDEEGRKKFFTLDMNNILLDIDLQVQEQPVSVRSAIYSHLVAFVPCNKEALLKRLKKLNLTIQDDKLKAPLLKLKLAVSRVMPEQIARYDRDCIARGAKQQAEGVEKNGAEEEDEEKPGRRVAGPRKKFIWDDKLRSLLCNLVRVKLGCYELESQGLLSAEDYLKTFMETEVKTLWPKGWMQARTLLKESCAVHSHLTGKLAKKKIVPTPNPKSKEVAWMQVPLAAATSSPALAPCQKLFSISETICLSDSLEEDLATVSAETSRSLAVSSSAVKSSSYSSPALRPAASSSSLVSAVGGKTANSSDSSSPSVSGTSPSVSQPTLVSSASLPISQSAGFGGTKSGGLMPVQRQSMVHPHKASVIGTSKTNPQNSSSSPEPQLQLTSSQHISQKTKAFCSPALKHVLATSSSGTAVPFHGVATPSPGLVQSQNKSICSNSHSSTTTFSQLNSKAPHIPSVPHSSLPKTPCAPPASSSSPSQPKPNQHHQSNFITPMQATLTKSSHHNNAPIVKLTPQPPPSVPATSSSPSSSVSPSPPSNLQAKAFNTVQGDSSKSPLLRPASSVQPGQVGAAQVTSGPPGSGHSVAAQPPGNNGLHQRAVGGASQASNPVAAVPVPSVTSQRPQGSSATVGLLGTSPPSLPLNFGMLGGLVPISLPFQYSPLLNFTSPGAVVAAMGGNSVGGNAAASSSSGYTLTQDISPGQEGEMKRNSQ